MMSFVKRSALEMLFVSYMAPFAQAEAKNEDDCYDALVSLREEASRMEDAELIRFSNKITTCGQVKYA